jgi:hypothetical protein
VIAATVTLQAGKAYTVAVFGQLTSVKAALLTDDMSRPGGGKSKVRLIQAIPGEAAVDLVSGGDELVTGARFPSASKYQEVPAGSVDVEVRKSGSGEVLAKASNLNLPSGSISSLVAVGGGLLGPPSGPVIELPIQLQRGPDVDRCRVDGGRATSSKGRPASQITITSRDTGPRRSMASRYGQAGWYRRWGGDVPEADLSVGGGGGQQLVPRVDRHRAKDEGMRQPSHQRAAGGIPHGGGPAAGGEQGAVGGERQAPDPAAVCR